MIDQIFETIKADILPKVRNVGKRIITMREESTFHITTKSDGSLVTNADRWANEELTTLIHSYFPDHLVIGEESESKIIPKSGIPTWYIDPIDGTKQFVQGKDHFYILMGCSLAGDADLGLFYKPAEDYWIIAAPSLNKLESNKPELFSQSFNRWSTSNSLTLKHFNDDQKHQILQFGNITKAPYLYHTIDLLGPLFSLTNGYLCFRRSYFWDICAPLAIMKTAGFKFGMFNASGESISFFFSEHKANSFYCLPADVPNDILKWFERNKPTYYRDD